MQQGCKSREKGSRECWQFRRQGYRRDSGNLAECCKELESPPPPNPRAMLPESVAPAITYPRSKETLTGKKLLPLQPPFCFLAENKMDLFLTGISPIRRVWSLHLREQLRGKPGGEKPQHCEPTLEGRTLKPGLPSLNMAAEPRAGLRRMLTPQSPPSRGGTTVGVGPNSEALPEVILAFTVTLNQAVEKAWSRCFRPPTAGTGPRRPRACRLLSVEQSCGGGSCS